MSLSLDAETFSNVLKCEWKTSLGLIPTLLAEMWWDNRAAPGLPELHPVPGQGHFQRPWKYYIGDKGQLCGESVCPGVFLFFVMYRLNEIYSVLFFIPLSGRRTIPTFLKWRSGSGSSLWFWPLWWR